MQGVSILNGNLWLSYSFLKNNGVTDKQLELWSYREISIKDTINGERHVLHSSVEKNLPAYFPSKNDLMGLANENKSTDKVSNYTAAFTCAVTKGYIKYLDELKAKYPQVSYKNIQAACKAMALFDFVVCQWKEFGIKDTEAQYRAIKAVLPEKYKSYNAFANAKSKAIKDGIESVAVKKTWFTARLNVKTISVVNQYWANALIGIGKKYNNTQVYNKLCALCEDAKMVPPSLSWVKKYRTDLLKRNISTFESRHGKAGLQQTKMPYASMQHAAAANDQWQMDGWVLPFWVDGYKRYTMVVVRDAYSKKIVGHATGESENTLLIMAALKDAIINTGCLPREIVTDNHAFNQTGEAIHFKEETGKIGMLFTVTSNPQWKSIIERYNKHLDAVCKECYGYLGEGIKSKNIDGRPKQELIDQNAKYQLTDNAVKLNGIYAVDTCNNTVTSKTGKSPAQLYEESNNPNCFVLTMGDKAKVLTPKTTIKVNRGQINIKRGFTKYEYQLPAELYSRYNDETVIVRYEDLNEEIYVFDGRTDEFITTLAQKHKINGAKANQTDKDIELLNKNKGRITGIKTQAKKANEELTRKALAQNPDAYTLLNKVTTPKDILKEAEQNSRLKQMAADKGINLETVYIPERQNELDNISLMPAEKKPQSPYSIKGKEKHIVTIAPKFNND